MTDAAWAEVGAAPFVSLGTYRRSGEIVATAVWIAPQGDALVVTTERSTGKVKRLRNDPRVTLRPCSRMGAVQPGATTVEARCEIAGPADGQPAASAALRRKYGLQYTLVLGFERLIRRLQRKPGDRVILRITRA
ncbi:PPOX class F420-dependent oxidoreductase [uncultured Amnibacterium sp.]|uniref:PPOX class F420-dependent oxidoreductase n=1 Tax=uncultured Amnibacterium sp. TaxID=1631851 RepID=UPI0035CAD501